MKRLFIGIVFLSAFIMASVFSSCQEKIEQQDLPVLATITIENIGNPDTSKCSVKFTPSEDAASFEYAIGSENDAETFKNGTMQGIMSSKGNSPLEKTFENLQPNTIYTVFARAITEDGEKGSIALYRIMTADNLYKAEFQYLTDVSAGVTLHFSNDYCGTEYYLGNENDREAFINGVTDNKYIEDLSITHYNLNFLELESSTPYILFLKGIDRSGAIEYRELPFTTYAEGDCPKATLDIKNLDIYKGIYHLVPNDKTGKIIAFIGALGANDGMINNATQWAGDIVNMSIKWAEGGFNQTKEAVGETLIMEHKTMLVHDYEMEMYVTVFDQDMNPAGVQRFTFKTPSVSENPEKGSVSIEISDITSKGASYNFTPTEDLFAFFYDTVDATWYDDFKKNSSDWHEYYLSESLFKQGFYWIYVPELKTDSAFFKEEKGEPNTRYYAAACPMNSNGPGIGWMPIVFKEYTTLSE